MNNFFWFWIENFNFLRFWWQYFISCLIFLLGVLFLFFLKSENVIFNKRVFFNFLFFLKKLTFTLKSDKIEVVKKNFFCRSKRKTRNIANLVSVEIVKRGTSDFANRTIHYKLVLYFSDEKPLEILESSSKFKIKQRVIILLYYFGKFSFF